MPRPMDRDGGKMIVINGTRIRAYRTALSVFLYGDRDNFQSLAAEYRRTAVGLVPQDARAHALLPKVESALKGWA